MSDKRIQFKDIVRNQLPQYVREEFPLVEEFITQYYLSQEFQGAPSDLIQNIDQYIKIDSITNLTDYTVLGSDISSVDTNISVDLLSSETGTNGFPEKYGLISIDNELIVYESKSFDTFYNCYRGFSGIISHKNTNVGIASTYKLHSQDQLIFKDSESDSHTYGSKIYNLSSLFLKEFLIKTKYQLSPGFEDRSFVDKVNESILIKQIKDFYRSKGTDRSFEILFKALYAENVQVIRPKDYLFRPSDAQYKITNDLVVEKISGPIEDISNLTLFQDEYLNISKSYGPVTEVENISSYDGKIFYKLKIDGGYDRDTIVDGSIYGKFSVHPKTRVIGKVLSGSTTLDVDSTVGFPTKGELFVIFEDGTEGVISYNSKNITQFLECSNVSNNIEDNAPVAINTYAYATNADGQEIRVRINSILSGVNIPENTYYYSKDDTATIRTLGFDRDDKISNDWVFNISPTYEVKYFDLVDFADSTYSLTLENKHIFKLGDQIQIIDSSNIIKDSVIIDIPNDRTIIISGQGNLNEGFYKVKRKILKVNSLNFPSSNVLTANIQNIYKENDSEDVLVASSSIPYYPNQSINVSDRSIIFSGSFIGDTFKITSLVDHGFYTGDSVYYIPEKTETISIDIDGNTKTSDVVSSSLFDEGIYFIKRVDSNNVKFARSRSDILNGNFINLSNQTSVFNNKIKPYEFLYKTLESQKLLRKISEPTPTEKSIETHPGFTGILVNGVEILNYKSNDKIIYGPIESVDVISNGSGYDIISPPQLLITDNIGVGATGYCSVSGSLQQIRILDPGFDYQETPSVKITGGNGVGAEAKANMKSISHEVYFNSEFSSSLVGLGSAISTIEFSTSHKFRNGEQVIYKTYSQKAISGLSTNSTYYVSTISPTKIKLYRTLGDSISGINTVFLNDYGIGNHSFESVNKKLILSSVTVTNSGQNYQNKKRVVSYSGINTSTNEINIENHDYQSGELIRYYTNGSPIGGLSNNTDYYLTKVDNNSFKLSLVSSGDNSKFYYETKQFVNITSRNNDVHIFNYPEISVELIGNVGISSSYKAQIQPIFRGEISSVYLTSGGSSYGVEDIFNIDRQPLFELLNGSGAEFTPIVSNGQIKEVLVKSGGDNYTSPPNLIINGVGSGAVLVPIISNNKITEIRVIDGGSGYLQESTEIILVSSGSGAKFKARIKTWTVNLFQKYLNSLTDDDGILTLGTNKNYGLQYSHLYAPRKLREILYSKDQDGKILYSNSDLRIVNNSEIESTDHSPIIGWSYDGHPIYGPYGYSKKSGGVVSQIKSGYRLTLDENRPSLNYFPEGFFVEDYKHYASNDETILDENNGRFCITPEFPNGVYAYFATLDTSSLESSGPFIGYKKPAFPYLVGNYYNSKPNQFNFERTSNQDDIDLNETAWIRNTYPYNLTETKSTYEYITIPNKLNQTIDVVGVSPGSIDRIGILTGGDNYKVNDIIVFDNTNTNGLIKGSAASAIVSDLAGKFISSISVASTTLYGVEIYPTKTRGEYVIFNDSPHNITNSSKISISGLNTTSSLLEGNYIAGIETSKLSLVGVGTETTGISSIGVTGIVTFISVRGANISNIRENDIFTINNEKIKVLNIDTISSRLRILRQIDGTIGTSHSVTSILYENPRKLLIRSGFNTEYIYNINKEIYFDPKESLALGSNTTLGIGTTISFSNPGAGITQVFAPLRSIYLPNHQINTGDSLTYKTNGGSGILVSSSGIGFTVLSNNSLLYAAKIDDNFIGISTVKVGLGSTGFFSGISTNTKNIGLLYFVGIGTGRYHSFETNYSVLTGQISKSVVTVSTAQTHGLSNGDHVEIDVNPGISTIVTLKYNDYNRRLLINPRSFSSGNIDLPSNTITIENHGFISGQKVIYTSNSPSGGLFNNEIYYIVFVDKNNIKLSNTYFNSKNITPNIIDITSVSSGTLSLINPPLKLYKNSSVIFDLSDSSLSYTYQSNNYPAFRMEFYYDSNFKNIFDSTKYDRSFSVQRFGTVGVSSDAKVVLDVNDKLPEILYYNLVPIYDSIIPNEKKEIIFDVEVDSYNSLQIQNSLYNGRHEVSIASSTSFEYFLQEIPESYSYNSSYSDIKYYTNSISSYGPIKNVKILNKGLNYYSLPAISSIISTYGKNASLEALSTSIGKIKKTKILNVGFDFPSDYTLRPNISLPKIIKIDRLSSFDSIKVTSFGRGYVSSPKLLVFDGKTKELIPEVDLKYQLNNPEVLIKNNTYGISNVDPIIIPIENSNGVGIRTISYNPMNKKVTVGLSTGFPTLDKFPFRVNDKVLIENISVGVGSTGKGFNSENYNYKLFTITDIDANIGGIGSVFYSLDGSLSGSEFPGSFSPQNSSGRIIPEKFFPTFASTLKKNEYKNGEIVKSGNSIGIVENWDSETNYLKISTKNIFKEGEKIEGLSSKTQGIASSITDFNCYASLNSTSKFENGWQINAGFLNDDIQKIQDSDYYQNFSYSLKSKITYEDWNDAVSALNHTVGFKKFSDLQLESKVLDYNSNLSVGVSTQTTSVDVIVDLVGYGNLNCVNDFDLARENSIRVNSRVFSDQIFFKNRILTDYYESVGNRVLLIDDFSNTFNSNPRSSRYSEINRFDTTAIRAQKYFVYIKDRRYVAQRQCVLLTLLHDNFNAYINQYGRVETSYDLGNFDFVIDGFEGVLQFYPVKYSINDYDIGLISYNIRDNFSAIGSTSIGSLVDITGINTTFAQSSTTNVVSFATTYTSSKVLVQITGEDGDYELNEINIIHDGTNVDLIEYGELTTKSGSYSGYGTYYPYISGSEVKVDFVSNAGIGSTNYINTIQVSITDTSNVGIATFDMKHSRLEVRTTSIPSSPTPSEQTILEYSEEYDAAYCLVQITDVTNNRHQLSEIISLNDDINPELYITEFANLETHSGLGTIGGVVINNNTTSQLTFTPLPNIETQVKVYSNILRLQDDDKDIVDFNNGTIETTYGIYYGTERDIRRSFNLTHKSFPIFEKYFSGFSTSVIDLEKDTIEIPGHFFTTGEKVKYISPGSSQSIGIAQTNISGIGLTDKLPPEVYIVKVNDNKVKVSASASDALKIIPNTLDLVSVGIGTSHRFVSNNQNSRVIISIDNIIQSPVVSTSQTTTLTNRVFTTDEIIYFSGITSFFGGDLIKIGNEIMVIESVGLGSTNAIKVKRPWLGTSIAGYSTGSLVTKVRGNYNIVDNVVNFVESPYGKIPLSTTSNSPDERDWTGLSTGSQFSGRVFMRSGVTNGSSDAYSKNYVFDDISNSFNGTNRLFGLKSSGSNISGISNDNAVILINDVFQGPGLDSDYTLIESSGITSIRFAGTASSVSYDINTSNLPTGGIIVSVGSTEGLGYQPLISAGGTAIVSGFGTISSISIGNSGSGYRSGIQTVRVGVQTYDSNGSYIKFIGTAFVSNGNVVSIAVTNPGTGYTSTNPPKVIIDDPLSYSDLPLVYSSSSPIGFGTAATVDIVVGQGSSIIDFEIKNTGYGYREMDILTIQSGGLSGIPTTSAFKEFKLEVQKVFSDKFTGWSVGELQSLDDISDLFDGETTTFPLTESGNLVSIKASKGSNINVQDLLLVFINDILQVPGKGYIFEGGSVITFTEAPKGPVLNIPGTNDKCKILFYKGSGSVDVIEKNILETVKIGDQLILGYDSSIGQSYSLQEDERTVTSILSTDIVKTNPYFGPGNTENESLERTISWCRQTEDKIINEKEIPKNRMLYEPLIYPSSYIIKPIGVGETVVYVDNIRPFFNPSNESNDLNFQNNVKIISQDLKIGAIATAIVSSSGKIESISVIDGGFGYVTPPLVSISSPIGFGTTSLENTAYASAILNGDTVSQIIVENEGNGYTTEFIPQVLIESPSIISETNPVVSYEGDYGIIVGFGTTSTSTSNKVIFDFYIPKDSYLRNNSVVSTATTISSISVGDYFLVYDSNVGIASTSVVSRDSNNDIIGITTQFVDNVYQVDSVSTITSNILGIGNTYIRRVYAKFSGISTCTFGSTGIYFDSTSYTFDSNGISTSASYSGGISTSNYFGNFSWGKITLSGRTESNTFEFYGNRGALGIVTSSYVVRSSPLKYSNYI